MATTAKSGKRRWDDLTIGQQIGLVVLAVVQIGLLAVALWDLAHRSPDEVRGGRRLWAGLVFINWFGPLAYFTVGRKGFLRRVWSWCSGGSARLAEARESEPV